MSSPHMRGFYFKVLLFRINEGFLARLNGCFIYGTLFTRIESNWAMHLLEQRGSSM